MEPLVSILIPAFNAARYIGDAIASATAQTWPQTEVIVVDDGSTDQTYEIAMRFVSDKVSVVKQANAGASSARNHAFSLCRGDYIQWLDADDQLAPDKIALQLANGGTPARTLLSSAWGYFFRLPERATFRPTALWCDLEPVEWLLRKMTHTLFMQTGTWLVSRELTEAAGPWDERISLDDDGEYFSRVVLASDGIRFVPDAKVFYRVTRAGNLSHAAADDRKLKSQLLSTRLQISHLRAVEQSPRVDRACVQLLQAALFYLYPHRPDLVAEARALAAECGGELTLPHLSRKYLWLQKAFGWSTARQVERSWNNFKTAAITRMEEIVARFDRSLRGQRLKST